MKINLLNMTYGCCAFIMSLSLLGCQPQSNSGAMQSETDLQIQARRVPVKAAAKVVCEKEGCVGFDLHTVDSNVDWIDDYFMQRIRQTEPVAFSKVVSRETKKPKQPAAPDYLDQRLIQVEFVSQRDALATFVLKSSNLARHKGDSFSQVEYINFDLRQKKRLALHQMILKNSEQKLLNAAYQANSRWLNAQGIQLQQLKLSDNYYFDHQGLVMVYPAGELAQVKAGRAKLKLPYSALTEIIQPEYLNILLHKTP